MFDGDKAETEVLSVRIYCTELWFYLESFVWYYFSRYLRSV